MKKETMAFLQELYHNNSVEWMNREAAAFEQAKEDFTSTITDILTMLQRFDHHLFGLTPEDCIFPQERDLSLSKFTEPFKTHFGAYVAMGGRKSDFAGYYIQVQPGNSFLGAGMYAPTAPVLRKIRQDIDRHPSVLRDILQRQDLRETFSEIVDDKIEKYPYGFPRDHQNILLLKQERFFGIHNLDDKQVTEPDFVEYCSNCFQTIFPLNQYLNEVFIN